MDANVGRVVYGLSDLPEPPASMSETTEHAIAYLVSTSSTRHVRDRAQQAILIRSARNDDEKRWIMQVIIAARRSGLDWLTRTQREWQTRVSHRPARPGHRSDHAGAMRTREEYVRCQA